LLELRNKSFTPFLKKGKPIEENISREITNDEESPTDNIEPIKGVFSIDYEYILSMAILTLALEKIHQLGVERDKFEDDVEELRKATPKYLWCKYLDNFTKELDVCSASFDTFGRFIFLLTLPV